MPACCLWQANLDTYQAFTQSVSPLLAKHFYNNNKKRRISGAGDLKLKLNNDLSISLNNLQKILG